MIVVLDASTLINLVNGEVLSQILGLPDMVFHMSGSVRSESKSIAQAIDAVVAARRLRLVDDSLISASAFRQAKRQMELGDGETECILAAEAMSCSIGCDDRAARRQAQNRLGLDRLTGTIGLLRMAVAAQLLSADEAFACYSLMILRGGYLPQVSAAEFQNSSD